MGGEGGGGGGGTLRLHYKGDPSPGPGLQNAHIIFLIITSFKGILLLRGPGPDDVP